MAKRRGQAAIEYLMITGIALMIIVPLSYLVFSYAQESSGQIANAQIDRIGRQLVNTAESVFYYGEPSTLTLDVNMPEGVRNLTIVTNDPVSGCTKCTELRFVLQAGKFKKTLSYSSRIEMRARPSDYSKVGNGEAINVFNRTAYSQGLKHFKLEAMSNHVRMTLE